MALNELPIRERDGYLIMSYVQFVAMGWARACRVLGIGDGLELDAERDRDETA